jgi:hypothetical protein
MLIAVSQLKIKSFIIHPGQMMEHNFTPKHRSARKKSTTFENTGSLESNV